MPQASTSKQTTKRWPLLLAATFVVLLTILSITTGAYTIGQHEEGYAMLFISRIPRTASLMLTGAGMSVAGYVIQLMSQNRFVEPTTTGTLDWAGLGLMTIYLLIRSPSLVLRMIGAILGAFIGTVIYAKLIDHLQLRSTLMVPVLGMMLGATVSAATTYLGLRFQMTHMLEVWFAGSFAQIQQGRYELLWLLLILVIGVFIFADRLTIAALGESMTTNLGLDYPRIRLIATILVALITGVVAAVIGYIPFLGLIVPNLISMWRGDHLRSNLIWGCLLGMSVLLGADLLSRTIIAPFEIPVSFILGTVGAFVFGIVLFQLGKGSEES